MHVLRSPSMEDVLQTASFISACYDARVCNFFAVMCIPFGCTLRIHTSIEIFSKSVEGWQGQKPHAGVAVHVQCTSM